MRLVRFPALAACALGVATISATVSATASASEIRLGVTYPGQTGEITSNSTLGGTTSSGGWSQGMRGNVDYLWTIPLVIVGFSFGPGVSVDTRKGTAEGSDLEYRAYSGHLSAGPYFAIIPSVLKLELMGFAGVGTADLKATTSGTSQSQSSRYTEYGANLNVVVAVPVVGLEAGAGVGWLSSTSDQPSTKGGTNVQYQVKNGAPTYNIFVGYRF